MRLRQTLLALTALFYTGLTFSLPGGGGGFNPPPGPPTSITSPSSSSSGQYTVSWNSVSNANYYEWQQQYNGTWDGVWKNSSSTSLSISVSNSGTYRYRVKSCNNFTTPKCGPYYDSGTTTVALVQIPGTPSSISISDGTTSIDGTYTVSWGTSSNSPTSYQYREKTGSSWGSWISNGTSRSKSISGKANGTYAYQARGCNSAGCGSARTSSNVVVSIPQGNTDWQNTGGSVPDATWSGDTPVLNGNLGVGSIEGSAGVSGGAANYSIPIATPPGRAGMQPSLSLSYSSRSGNGIAGQGWSLSAGSSIHRCSGIYDIDNDVWRNVQLNSSDKLCLDGQRLKRYSGTYGVSGSYYHPETDPTTRVRLYNAIDSSAAYFTVETKSGGRSFYGNTSDSRVVRQGTSKVSSWLLKKSEDKPSKNNIIYSYSDLGDAGQKYLTTIYYTGYNGATGDRTVNVAYETRPDIRFDYLANTYAKSTKRLESVTTKVGSKQVAKFRLIYRNDNDAVNNKLALTTQEWTGESAVSSATNTPQTEKRKSLLDSVELCAWRTDGVQECLPRSVFDMEYWKAGVFAESKFMNLTQENESYENLLSGDFDNDAKMDYAFAKISGGMSVWLSSKNQRYDISNLVNTLSPRKNSVENIILDYDLDGQMDFLGSELDSQGLNRLTFVSWNGSSFVKKSTNILVDCGFKPQSNPQTSNTICQTLTLDFDGDGDTDLITASRSGTNLTLELYSNTGGSDNTPSFVFKDSLLASNWQGVITSPLVAADLEGDGRAELIGRKSYSTSYNSNLSGYVIRIKKVNSQYQFVDERVGTYTFSSAAYTHPLASNHQLTDFNGDGLVDIISNEWNLNNKKFWVNTGGQFQELQNIASNQVGYQLGDKIFDYNHDGVPDYLIPYGVAYASDCGSIPSYFDIVGNGEDWDLWQKCNDYSALYHWKILQTEINTNGTLSFKEIGSPELGVVASRKLLHLVDHNGDGAVDIIANKGLSTMTSSHSLGLYWYKNPNAKADKIVKVNRGGDMSLIDEFSYDSLTNLHSSNRYLFSKGYFKPYVNFNTAIQMVNSYKSSNGIGGLNETKFSYTDARFNLEGRGFQGFKTITEEHVTLGTKTTNTFRQDFPFSGKVSLSESYAKNSSGSYQRISKVDTTWKTLTNQSAYLPYADPVISRNYDLNTGAFLFKKTNDIISIDTWGNVTNQKSIYSESDTSLINASESQTTTSSFVAKCSAVPNQPTWSQVTTKNISNRPSDYASVESGADITKSVKTTIDTVSASYCKPTKVTTVATQGQGTASNLYSVVNTAYNSYGLPTSVTTTGDHFTGSDMSNRSVTTTYSKDGVNTATDGYFVKTVTNSKGHVTTTEVDPIHGKATKVTDPNNQVTTMTYDAFARVRSTKLPGEPTQRVAYWWCSGVNAGSAWCPQYGNFKSKYRVLNRAVGKPNTYSYFDNLNRNGYGITRNFNSDHWYYNRTLFNSKGQKISQGTYNGGDGLGWQRTYFMKYNVYDGYDSLGRLLIKQSPQADNSLMETRYSYDGFETDITAIGETTLNMSRKYNGLGQLVWTEDADGNYTRYAYDGAGNPVTLQDASGNKIYAKYNALGQKEYVDDPNMGKKFFWYNTFGEVEKEVDANGDELTYSYDTLGRMTYRWINGTRNGRWVWDETWSRKGLGLLSWEENGSSFTNRLRKYYYYTSNSAGTKKVIDQVKYRNYHTSSSNYSDFDILYYTDTNYGRPKGMKYNTTGLTLAYDYNSLGYMTKIKNANGGYVYQEIRDLDAHGKVTDQLKSNGLLTEITNYHAATGQMMDVRTSTTSGDSLRHELSYQYDGFSNLYKQMVSTTGGVNSEEYQYDNLHRLTNSYRSFYNGAAPVSINYAYDAIGNFKYKSDYSAQNSTAYSYHASGSRNINNSGNAGPNAVRGLLKKGTSSRIYFNYDRNGNLLNGDGKTITYNEFNKPLTITKGGVTSTFSYGADLMRYKQVKTGAAGGTITTYYIDKLLEKEVQGSTTKYKHYIGDVAIQTKKNSTWDIGFTHRDRLGSVVSITDHLGNIKEHRSFDPFGKPRKGDFVEPSQNTLTSIIGLTQINRTTERGFTDHEQLDDHELIHMNGRAYDYNLGRFLSVDPFVQDAGNSQAMNPYSYVLNNPLAFTDPSGYAREAVSYLEKRYSWLGGAYFGGIKGCDASSFNCSGATTGSGALIGKHRGRSRSDANATLIVHTLGKPNKANILDATNVIGVKVVNDGASLEDITKVIGGGTDKKKAIKMASTLGPGTVFNLKDLIKSMTEVDSYKKLEELNEIMRQANSNGKDSFKPWAELLTFLSSNGFLSSEDLMVMLHSSYEYGQKCNCKGVSSYIKNELFLHYAIAHDHYKRLYMIQAHKIAHGQLKDIFIGTYMIGPMQNKVIEAVGKAKNKTDLMIELKQLEVEAYGILNSERKKMRNY